MKSARLLMFGMFLGVLSQCAVGTALVQALDFRDPAVAPPSWIQFAKLVKYRFEEWIGDYDAIAARFRVFLKAHVGTSDGPP